jgi:hypothetical protein
MVLDLDGEPLLARIGRRAFRHRPRAQRSVDLEPEVVMEVTRVVLLDDEPVPAFLGRSGRLAGGLAALTGPLRAVALEPIAHLRQSCRYRWRCSMR